MIEFFKKEDFENYHGIYGYCSVIACHANKILSERMKVGYCLLDDDGCPDDITDNNICDTHKIYYITEEIEKEDTLASLLQELIDHHPETQTTIGSIVFRAKKLLQKKGDV